MPDDRHRQTRPPRSEPREIVELRHLRETQPDLASAVDLQIALLDLQHRLRARLPTPWFEVDPEWAKQQQQQGRPLLRFEEVPLEWTDFRLICRQTADLLLRYEAIERPDHAALQAILRTGTAVEPLAVRWYNAKAAPERLPSATPAEAAPEHLSPLPRVSGEALDQVLALAMRPFLERCAEVLQQRIDLSGWREPHCPLCGGEPEFGFITQAADRLLICSRCAARWRFDPLACPYCRNDDRRLITSFASRDGRYRLYACDVCKRYLKAYDGRHASRPLLLAVDAIATLPLDAAAIQRGYRG